MSEEQHIYEPKYNLKSWTHLFQEIKSGNKLHDVRGLDRDFKVGDVVRLEEFDHTKGQYTGDFLDAEISYITSRFTPCALSSAVLDREFAILSLKVLPKNAEVQSQD